MIDPGSIRFTFAGELWSWRGPSPYHFVTVPDDACEVLRAVAPIVSYGWGVIPVRAQARGRTWDTSLVPRDGGFVLPVKDRVRLGLGLELGDVLEVELEVRQGRPTR